MKRNNLSVFSWSYSKRYYRLHPWIWIKELFDNIRAGWMRATRGYCYSDIWNWDSWFLEIVPTMLHILANEGQAYPGSSDFPTPESWHDWLQQISANFISCREEEQEKRNQYRDDFMNEIDKHFSTNPPLSSSNEIAQLYFNREKEIFDESQTVLRDTFLELSKHFYQIWD